jgi:DNA / pantothenate metabolism flavoprotein/Flavoprotein
VLASTCPVLLAPAMNTDMWEQAPVQRNWQQLQQDPRYHACVPTSGLLACDRVGTGRMAEPEAIIDRLQSLMLSGGRRDLQGQRVLVSTGGTKEFLDPVRFIGNPATGKMGLAIAQAAAHRGAQVDLVYGTLPQLPTEPEIRAISAPTSDRMAATLFECFPAADLIFMAAAVADVQPANYSDRKLAKDELPSAIPVVAVPDIAAELGRRKQAHQKLIGFAAQTGDIVAFRCDCRQLDRSSHWRLWQRRKSSHLAHSLRYIHQNPPLFQTSHGPPSLRSQLESQLNSQLIAVPQSRSLPAPDRIPFPQNYSEPPPPDAARSPHKYPPQKLDESPAIPPKSNPSTTY